MRFVVDDEVEIERRELFAVAAIHHQRLDRRNHHARTEQLTGAARRLEDHRLVFAQDHIEVLHRLLRQFDAIDDEQHALGVARDEEAANQRRAQQRLARAGRHFQQELALAIPIELRGNLVERRASDNHAA